MAGIVLNSRDSASEGIEDNSFHLNKLFLAEFRRRQQQIRQKENYYFLVLANDRCEMEKFDAY